MAQAAIVTHGVGRTFGDKVAVDDVDLTVETGEVYGFLGPNGAGKSTLTRMLCTLLAPTSGRATVAGHDVVRRPTDVRLDIGVALQDAALDEKQTGVEMLRLQGRFYGLTARETDRRLAELRELIDIGDALDQRVSTYSGGMKRRLDLALALVHNPRVLFLDEPTTGLDPLSRSAVWSEVRRLNTELGMTVFLTTQYLEEADALADRVGIINRGAIVAEGTPADLKRSIGTDLLVVDVGDQVEQARSALADLALVVALSVPVLVLGFALGVQFVTGVAGVLVFLLLAGLWGLAFTGFPYAIALRTGNPAAVNSSFLLFFPFAFLTTTFLPLEAMTGWLATIAELNPVTYLLAALRSLITDGWDVTALWQGVAAILVVGTLSFVLAFRALQGRTARS